MTSDSDDKKKIKDPRKCISCVGHCKGPEMEMSLALLEASTISMLLECVTECEIELEITECKTQAINAEDFPCYL